MALLPTLMAPMNHKANMLSTDSEKLFRSLAFLVSKYRKELYEENSLLELTFLTFLVPIIKFFVFTKNGNKKGYKCNKGLKIPNFSYLMRSKVTLPRFAKVNFNTLKSIGHVG